MKDKFIRFMKDNHALKEYEEIIGEEINSPVSLDDLMEDTSIEVLLENGWVFHHANHNKGIDWSDLHDKWIAILKEEELS